MPSEIGISTTFFSFWTGEEFGGEGGGRSWDGEWKHGREGGGAGNFGYSSYMTVYLNSWHGLAW